MKGATKVGFWTFLLLAIGSFVVLGSTTIICPLTPPGAEGEGELELETEREAEQEYRIDGELELEREAEQEYQIDGELEEGLGSLFVGTWLADGENNLALQGLRDTVILMKSGAEVFGFDVFENVAGLQPVVIQAGDLEGPLVSAEVANMTAVNKIDPISLSAVADNYWRVTLGVSGDTFQILGTDQNFEPLPEPPIYDYRRITDTGNLAVRPSTAVLSPTVSSDTFQVLSRDGSSLSWNATLDSGATIEVNPLNGNDGDSVAVSASDFSQSRVEAVTITNASDSSDSVRVFVLVQTSSVAKPIKAKPGEVRVW